MGMTVENTIKLRDGVTNVMKKIASESRKMGDESRRAAEEAKKAAAAQKKASADAYRLERDHVRALAENNRRIATAQAAANRATQQAARETARVQTQAARESSRQIATLNRAQAQAIRENARRSEQDARRSAKARMDAERQVERAAKEAANQHRASAGMGLIVLNQAADLAGRLAHGFASVAKTADTYTSVSARLGLIVDKGEKVADLQNKIYASAERSRSSYVATAGAVSKLGVLAKNAFKNNDEIVAFTELLNKSFIVSGSSAEEVASGVYQISQALSAGKLQGDEFRTVMEAAPMVAQSIAKYLNMDVGQLKVLGSEGKITADIMKNSMLAAAKEINEKFSKMPITFGQAWQIASDKAMKALQPLFARMNDWLNNQGGTQALEKALQDLGAMALYLGNMAMWVIDNWSNIEPVLVGLGTALLVYIGLTNLAAIKTGIMTLSLFAQAVGAAAAGFATWDLTAACTALSVVLDMMGIGLIVAAVALLVMWIWHWVEAVGGIKIAWQICLDYLLYAWDMVKFGWTATVNSVLDFIDKMSIGIKTANNAIADVTTDIWATILETTQNGINAAIRTINKFIESLNNIPGVEISTISELTFASNARAEAEAQKQQRAAKLAAEKETAAADSHARQLALSAQYYKANNMHQARQFEIAKAQKDAAAKKAEDEKKGKAPEVPKTPPPPQNINKVGEVGKINDKVSISDEDLKYMRDVARTKFVNEFKTLRPQVNATFGDVRETADVRAIMSAIADSIDNAVSASLA